MGVEDLWKHCVPGLKTKDQQHFKTAENARIAVDVSCLLHACMSKPKVALLVNCVPPYVPNEVIGALESNHRCFMTNNIQPLYVFDGCEHPMKANALAVRRAERLKAR